MKQVTVEVVIKFRWEGSHMEHRMLRTVPKEEVADAAFNWLDLHCPDDDASRALVNAARMALRAGAVVVNLESSFSGTSVRVEVL